jgi:hypothetical protein
MILAASWDAPKQPGASGEGPGLFLVSPDSGAEPGMRVK